MISATWNAPQQAFDDPMDFFEATGVDAVYFPLYTKCCELDLPL